MPNFEKKGVMRSDFKNKISVKKKSISTWVNFLNLWLESWDWNHNIEKTKTSNSQTTQW
jgi:hypothetical protein